MSSFDSSNTQTKPIVRTIRLDDTEPEVPTPKVIRRKKSTRNAAQGILPERPGREEPQLSTSAPDLIWVDGQLQDEYAIFLLDQKILFSDYLEEGQKVRLQWTTIRVPTEKKIVITERTREVYWGNQRQD